jgi:dephospho-CoA kinase
LDPKKHCCLKVGFVEQLYQKLNLLHAAAADMPELRSSFPKPSFKVVVLYVDEDISIARQMSRHVKSAAHNKKVREARVGKIMCAPSSHGLYRLLSALVCSYALPSAQISRDE